MTTRAGRRGTAEQQRHARVHAALRELYARVPQVHCRGLCASHCVPVQMSHAEAAAVEAASPHDAHRAGTRTALGAPKCPQLTSRGRCSVYDDRPMICRLFGTATHFECPHGCTPDGGYLTAEQCVRLMLDSLELGGTDLLDAHGVDQVRACLDVPGLAEALMGLMKGDRDAAAQVQPLLERAIGALQQRSFEQALPPVREALRAPRAKAGHNMPRPQRKPR